MQPYDIVTIQLFVAVAKTGSIAGAARQQHIAASAVSHRIHELELATGTKLLNRLPRGVELTAAGRVFMERGTRILNELRDLDKDLKQFAEGGRGTVRVAAVTTAITSRLSDILKSFVDGNPNISVDLIELYSNEALEALRQGECDIALVTDMRDLTGLESCHFSTDPVWVIGPSGHPLFEKRDAGGAIPFADAMQYEVISLHQGGALDDLVLAAAQKLGSPIKRALRVSRNDSLRPSQCSDLPWRARMFQIGTMSELPIVLSTGNSSMRNLTGLNGSIRPGPHSGFRYIQSNSRRCFCRARRVAGIRSSR